MGVSGIASGCFVGYKTKRTTRAMSEKGFDNTTIKGTDDLIAKKRVGITKQASVMDIYNSMGRFAGSISKVEETTGKDYLIQSDNWGGLTDAIPMTSSLHSALKEFMGVEEISSGQLNDKYVVYRDKFSGIETMKVKGNEGYREKYPNLVPSDESARALAMLEVIGHTVRAENGIIMVTSNGVNYMDENDTSKSWAIIYSMNGTDVYKEIMKAIQENIVRGGIENVSGWEDWFKGNGYEYEYERVLSDEELEQAANQESETKTDIIVKPDGSRVLVVTMSIGGMETTMSLEISKPTEAPNENSKQDTDNKMPTAENDTASGEMSNISTEA